MRSRLLLAVAAMLTLAACSESPTAPPPLSPAAPSFDYGTGPECKSGYHIATRSDGTAFCEAD
jgi:hypothetical protein